MTQNSKQFLEFQRSIMSREVEELQRKAKEESELLLKKKAIDFARTEAEYRRVIKAQEDLAAMDNINLDQDRDTRIEKVIKASDEYIEAAKMCKIFINKAFVRTIPFFAKNIILVGAQSGEGKSTATANIALETARQGGRVLILSNEETAGDVYNRITCLAKGWMYANHNEFTEEQKSILRAGTEAMKRWVDVVEDSTYGPGTTTTIEGIQKVLQSLLRNCQKYDVIIIDYIQKVSNSRLNPTQPTWEILNNAMLFLDNFKNIYAAPIVVMSQLHQTNGDKERSFEDRIKGYKGIITPSTCALEMIPSKKDFTTQFVVHKNRWYNGDLDGHKITVGWYKGKFVTVDNIEWKSWVKMKLGERIARTLEGNNGTGNKN